jgi:hypothetical protein
MISNDLVWPTLFIIAFCECSCKHGVATTMGNGMGVLLLLYEALI